MAVLVFTGMNTYSVYGSTISVCSTSAKTTISVFSPLMIFYTAFLLTKGLILQAKNVLMRSCDEDPEVHIGEREIQAPKCLHKSQFVFTSLCALVASKFVFDGSPSFSYSLGYPHRSQLVPALPAPCPLFLLGCWS